MHLSNNTNKTLIAIALYLSLLIGFYFGIKNTSEKLMMILYY